MRSSLILCVLLGAVLSVRAASLPRYVMAGSTTTPTTTVTSTVTGLYTTPNDLMTTLITTTPSTAVPNTSDPPFVTTTTPYPTTVPNTSDPPFVTTTTPYPTTVPNTSDPPFVTTTTPYPTTVPNTSDPPFVTTTTPYPTTVPNTSDPPFVTPPTAPPTTTSHSLTPSQIMCPGGWEVFQGRCYYFVNEGMTWPQAQSNCAMLGSMLVSVHSAQEYGFLQQFTTGNGNQDAWLGGFYLQDQWLWLDGSWFYNNSFSSESPDSSNPCLLLNSYEAWSNSPCNAGGYSSICVKDSNVPPEMLCPQGWMGFQGRCFYYNSNYLSWPDADTNCALLGASLASVHSPEEYAFLYQQNLSTAWIGGFYLDDQWMWLDGSWFYQGFYSQMSSPDSTYSCLSTYFSYGWTNWRCEKLLPSYCEKNAVV